MLSAYFAGKHDRSGDGPIYKATIGRVLDGFGKFQDWLEDSYERILKYTVKHPLKVLSASFVIFILSMGNNVARIEWIWTQAFMTLRAYLGG